jgi:myo-inositol-1(or 4)-monophosphatase
MTDATRRAVLAERAARAGGVVANETFRETLSVETKADKNDVVTEADRDAQHQVVSTIRQEFPDDPLVCEEDVPMPGVDDDSLLESVPESGPAWVVDPIDGTANYVRGIRFWGTSVAAVVDGEPVGVATYLPAEQDIYTAGPESVTLNGSVMSVSDRTDPETFMTGLLGWWPMHNNDSYAALFDAATERFGDVRRLGMLQGVLALVAAGSLDAGFMPETPHPWDAIAGVHMIRRAGGTATDIHGDRWRHDSEGLVVSNGECHDIVLEAVQDGRTVEAAD